MAPLFKEKLICHYVHCLPASPFGFVNDGSSDTGLKKVNATCAFIFDVNRSKRVKPEFHDTCATFEEDPSTASTLFASIENAKEKHIIRCENVAFISLDSCSTNMGRQDSVKSELKR